MGGRDSSESRQGETVEVVRAKGVTTTQKEKEGEASARLGGPEGKRRSIMRPSLPDGTPTRAQERKKKRKKRGLNTAIYGDKN